MHSKLDRNSWQLENSGNYFLGIQCQAIEDMDCISHSDESCCGITSFFYETSAGGGGDGSCIGYRHTLL